MKSATASPIAWPICIRHSPRMWWFEDGHVQVAGNRLTFAAAAGIAYENRVSLSATGFYKTPKVEWDRVAGKGRPFLYFAYGAAISEVVIDTLTGENRILRADILHDAGAPLNPAIDLGQVEGGYVQGCGVADDRGIGLGRQGEAHDPRAFDLQDPRRIGPARSVQRGPLGKRG